MIYISLTKLDLDRDIKESYAGGHATGGGDAVCGGGPSVRTAQTYQITTTKITIGTIPDPQQHQLAGGSSYGPTWRSRSARTRTSSSNRRSCDWLGSIASDRDRASMARLSSRRVM